MIFSLIFLPPSSSSSSIRGDALRRNQEKRGKSYPECKQHGGHPINWAQKRRDFLSSSSREEDPED